MDNLSQPQNEKEEKRRSSAFYLSIIAILSVLCILLTWQFFSQRTRIQTIEKERIVYVEKSNSLQIELSKLKEDYQTLQTSDSKIRAELDEKIRLIEEMQKEAEKHKNDAYIIYKLEKEAETLRKIMKHFVQQIDSLGRLNKEIREEKQKVETQLETERDKSSQLTKQKEELESTVALGSVLKANGIKVIGVRFRSGGKKEIETTSAKRTEKFKISFTIGENAIAAKGERTVYVRIVTPDGKEMAKSMDESNQFKFNNSKGYFATKTNITYYNQETKVTMYTSESKIDFLPGKYLIEITTDGVVIGSTNLILD